MKIGILSDTHTKIKLAQESLDILLHNGAEFIVHAGDVCEVATLELLKNCGIRYVCVYGNNDAHLVEYHHDYNLVKEPHYFKLANTSFKLMHLPFYMTPDTEIVLFGHTHAFESRFIEGTLFLNPGESCARNKPISECAMLEVTQESLLVTHFSKDENENVFSQEHFSYQRKNRG